MKFNSMYGPGVVKTGLDYSRTKEDIFTEIQPYAVDIQSGQFLNKSPFPILKKTGCIDVNEKIQSYASECDIYKILEKFALTGDSTFINQRVGNFGDFCNLPDNINDFNNLMNKYFDTLKAQDKDVAKMILNDKVTTEEIIKLIDSRIAEQMIAKKENDINE